MQRFYDPHRRDFDEALAEIRRSRKVSHWMWYIFPQLKGLGRSSTAQFYGLDGLEEAERLAHELHVPPPETVAPPKWLNKKHHAEFCQLADTLATLGLYTDLDQDVLAQYLQCRERWLNADKQAAKAIRAKDEKTAASWTGIQGSYFKQARQCAEAMGLSVTSRCRLVVPQSSGQPTEADNPFLRLIEGGAVKRA